MTATTTLGLPTGDDKRRAVRQMFDAIAGRYEMVNTIMAFGLDRSWRHRCASALGLAPGARVLDVACGTGNLCRDLAQQRLMPVGVDLSAGMLSASRREGQLPLVMADALAAPFPDGCFDGAVSGFALRNVVDLGQLFVELARLVRPGGRVSLLDLSEPQAPLMRWGHRLWAGHAVPLVGSLLSDTAAYRYLPRSLAYLPPAAVIVSMLEEAGFAAVLHQPMSGGVAQLFVATRRQATTSPGRS